MKLTAAQLKEATEATKMLAGKIVEKVWRHRQKEIGIQFTDGTRFFVDHNPEGVEASITGAESDDEPSAPDS